MSKIFGTDGARGIVNAELSADLIVRIGASVSKVLKSVKKKDKLTFLIGSDTRISKCMLTSLITGGVLSEGCDIIDVGVIPTPAISYLITKYELDGGFVISASHNPSEYNGIKVLDEKGMKISEEIEEKCEEYILSDIFPYSKNKENIGTIIKKDNALDDYAKHLLSSIDTTDIKANILVDTANGAASEVAKEVFKHLTCHTEFINNNPDGYNINKNAGSTHIDTLKQKVKEGHFDLGIAYDGDADRCILVDENGRELDGDYILAIAGLYLKEQNRLKNNRIVGTVMANLGFVRFCEKHNIDFYATSVGDKYVLEEMLKKGDILGGEQCGHIIFKDYANTGDGILTSLQILNIFSKKQTKLSELANIIEKYPQILINVEVSKEGRSAYDTNENIKKKIKETESILTDGRILVRPSGTENLIRVMIEGKDDKEIKELCENLAEFIKKELN